MTELTRAVTIASIVGTGLMAGLFFTFSAVIMRSLEKLPPTQGLMAMQSINLRIINPVFLLVFLGSAALCLLVAVLSFIDETPGRWWRLVGAVAYLVGIMVVTFAVNVPLNDTLAAVDPNSATAAQSWQDFLSSWNPPNHVRTVAGILAVVFLALGLPSGSTTGSAAQVESQQSQVRPGA